jgi:glucan-binding YG repeat protein
VSVDGIAFYTGSPVEPEVRVRYKQTSLTNGVDYSLRYENNVAEGVATVIVTGKGDYTGEARASFRITNASAYSLSSAGSVYLSGERFLYGGDSFLLVGSKVEPSVSVSLKIGNSRKQLIEGVDYAVSYSSNSSVGTGYVTVKGINGISGSITKSFQIVNSLDVSMLGLGLYDFESDEYLAPAKPKILPSDNFVENVDYRLSYENCDKVGRGKVTVHGMGRYTGTASVEVNIVDKLKRSSLSDCTIDAIPSQVYTGEPIVPNVIVRDGNGRALDSGLEYAVCASDNVNVGTAKVLAHMGAGFVGYSGYLESSFSIEPADINSVEVAGIEDKEYSGKPVTQDALTLTYNGKSLVEGEDYSVEYSDNTKVGSAALKITGEGNFAGERTINFQVKPKTMQYDFVLKEGVASDPSFWNDTMGSTTYRIDLPQGGMVYLGTTLMGVESVLCSLSDSNGEVLYTWSPKSGETYGAFALAPGSYYFTLLGSTQYDYGTVGARYDVVKFGNNARFQYEMEPNSPSKEQTIPEVATKIELGGVVAGSFYDPLSSLDLDYYEFTLPEYGPVSMDIVTNKSLMFALVNENGVVIADSITGQSIFEETPNSDETTTMHFGILEPGTYYVCCTARYSSSNGASYFLRVHEDLTAARVDFESTTLEYTGKALEPHPTVTRYGSELKEGSDYYVTYDNNVAPGKARATIVGMGRFGGAGVYVGFNIVRSPGNYIALPGHWATESGGWWYPYDNGGYPANEWCIIDGSYYHFDGSGYMQTGWLNLGGTWYYLSGSGIMQTGWQKIGGSWYWFDDSGAMASGWRVVDGSYYCFDGSGVMQTGWQSTGGAWYWLGGSGAMRTGWQAIGGAKYFFDDSGAMASGWKQIDGSYYYFDGSGVMQTGWLSTGGAWYYLSGSGAMATGWQTIGGAKYWFDDSGAMATGWKWIGGSCYYFDGSGAMQTDKLIDGSYVDSDGRWDQNA